MKNEGQVKLYLKESTFLWLKSIVETVAQGYDKFDNATSSMPIFDAEGQIQTHELTVGWNKPHKENVIRVIQLTIKPV